MKEFTEKTYSTNISFALSTLFLILALTFNFHLTQSTVISDLSDLDLFELTILSLTIFRLVRLFVYDSISQFIRDWFLDLSEVQKDGKTYIHRKKPKNGLRRAITDLLGCPWCASVWISLFSVYVYLLVPNLWFVYLVLAMSGIASFIQISINRIGWQAEYKKTLTHELKSDIEIKNSDKKSKSSSNC